MPSSDVVPVFSLYGERQSWPTPDLVHCESIETRSRLHGWHIRPHQHSGLFQILHIRDGGARVQLDGRADVLTSGQVLTVPQGCIHGFEFEEATAGVVLTLAQPLVNRLLAASANGAALWSRPVRATLDSDATGRHVGATFDAFEREYRGAAADRVLAMEALLGTITIWLARHAADAPRELQPVRRNASRHFARFGDLLERHFLDHLPVPAYAEKIGVTAAHLNTVCRDMTGKSALELIHERLLLEARRNLVYTAMQVGEIAHALGFSEPPYFTRFFKRATGMSPVAFRQNAERRLALRDPDETGTTSGDAAG